LGSDKDSRRDAGELEQSAAIQKHPYRFLGSYRFLLALLVLVSHSHAYIPAWLGDLALGNVGVFLFFVVSGFVICEALDVFYRSSSSKFLANRALKIFPAYWIALAITYLIHSILGIARFDGWSVFVNVTLLPAFLPSGNTLLLISVAWAVLVEVQFYLAAALAFFFARKLRAPYLLVACGVAALVGYIFVWQTNGYARFYGALQHAPYFVMGSASYFIVARRKWVLMFLTLPAAVLSLHSFYSYGARGEATNVLGSTALFAFLTIAFFVLAVIKMPRQAEAIDKSLGDITYSVYLVHMSVLLLVASLQLDPTISFLAAVTGSLVLAWIVRVLAERPLVGLRNSLRGFKLYDR
jgi:peptidoglycan/LPS O-acetylase OafA/YrhL